MRSYSSFKLGGFILVEFRKMCYNEDVAIRRNAHFHCQVDVVVR